MILGYARRSAQAALKLDSAFLCAIFPPCLFEEKSHRNATAPVDLAVVVKVRLKIRRARLRVGDSRQMNPRVHTQKWNQLLTIPSRMLIL